MACRQIIIWTNADLLSFKDLETNSSEIWMRLQQFSPKKVVCKMVAIFSRPQYLDTV